MTDYPPDLQVRPLTSWPGELTRERIRSPFSAPFRSTITLLRKELGAIDATTPVMEVAIPPEQFRIDGRPRATAKASHPGVVLSLPRTSVGPLRYATDRYTTWQENLRAIALGMEALRRVERYGITRRGEQYTGFRAIESGDITSREDALAFLTRHAPGAGSDQDRYRVAARRLHPDAGGDPEEFKRLQAAMRILRGAR